MSDVSRLGFLPSRSATHRSSAYTNAICLALIAGIVRSRVSVVSGCAVAVVAGARSPTARDNAKKTRFMMNARAGGKEIRIGSGHDTRRMCGGKQIKTEENGRKKAQRA